MSTLLKGLGIAVLIFVAYWMLVVVPKRKDCSAKAFQTYSQVNTNYSEGLISSERLKEANNVYQAELSNCYK